MCNTGLSCDILSLSPFLMHINHVSPSFIPQHVFIMLGKMVSLENFIHIPQVFKLAIDFSLPLSCSIK